MNRPDSILANAGRDSVASFGMVNPPVCRASTILFPDLEAFEAAKKHLPGQLTYGRYGTPTTLALEAALNQIEGGHGSLLYPSGLAAITGTLTALLAPGDHMLVTDSVYGPTRHFITSYLARIGVTADFFDPKLTSLEKLVQPQTRCVFLESPGSLTFEIQDVPALSASVKKVNPEVAIVMDNTWSTPMFFRPLEHGVDIALEAATKYLGGHSDVMMGTVTCNEAFWTLIEKSYRQFGICVGADDAYTVLRGLRTLATRMRQHEANALFVARWLDERAEVERVLHPALPADPGHMLWKRDWSGSSGLFGCVLKPVSAAGLRAFFTGLKHFGMGGSWGGYESLLFPDDPARHRSATPWAEAGQFVRLHIGLEDVRDLVADLEAAFLRMRDAAPSHPQTSSALAEESR